MLSTRHLQKTPSLYRAKGAVFGIFSDGDSAEQDVSSRVSASSIGGPVIKKRKESLKSMKPVSESGLSVLQVKVGFQDEDTLSLKKLRIDDKESDDKENHACKPFSLPCKLSEKKTKPSHTIAVSVKRIGERKPLSNKSSALAEKKQSKSKSSSSTTVVDKEKKTKPKTVLTSTNGICTGTLVEKEFPWHLNPGLKDEKDELEELMKANNEDYNKIAKQLTESPLAEVTQAFTGQGTFKVLYVPDCDPPPTTTFRSSSQTSSVSAISTSSSDKCLSRVSTKISRVPKPSNRQSQKSTLKPKITPITADQKTTMTITKKCSLSQSKKAEPRKVLGQKTGNPNKMASQSYRNKLDSVIRI